MIPPPNNPLCILAEYRQDAERVTHGATFMVYVDRRLPTGRRHLRALTSMLFAHTSGFNGTSIADDMHAVADHVRDLDAQAHIDMEIINGDPLGTIACDIGHLNIGRIDDTTLRLTASILADTDTLEVQQHMLAYVRAHRLLHIPAAMVAPYLQYLTAENIDTAYEWFSKCGLLQYCDVPFSITGMDCTWPDRTVSVLNALIQTGPFLNQVHRIDDEGYVYLHVGGHVRSLHVAIEEDRTDDPCD